MARNVKVRQHTPRDRQEQQLDFLIVSPTLTIEAMRDSGYKDTDHALAELIDNSVEARADLVEIIAVETPPDPQIRLCPTTNHRNSSSGQWPRHG